HFEASSSSRDAHEVLVLPQKHLVKAGSTWRGRHGKYPHGQILCAEHRPAWPDCTPGTGDCFDSSGLVGSAVRMVGLCGFGGFGRIWFIRGVSRMVSDEGVRD